MHYLIDAKRVAHQEVDGEVIVIDFATGTYFSMTGTAGEIWQMVASGAPVGDIVAFFRERSPDIATTVESEIARFFQELEAADLVQRHDGPGLALAEKWKHQSVPFAPPLLEKFEDMAHLIMLDPVHDVSDQGWPYRPEGAR